MNEKEINNKYAKIQYAVDQIIIKKAKRELK